MIRSLVTHPFSCLAIKLLLTLAVVFPISLNAESLTFTRIVASDAGHGRRDGFGVDARFSNPTGIAVDAAGNIYVTDTYGCTIRKISPTGQVRTLAGRASRCGFANGRGENAKFNHPEGLAVDAGGNVYVADTSNNVIRKITPTGIVSTLSGSPTEYGSTDGPPNAARFWGPRGMAIDAAGNLYVHSNSAIRKIAPDGSVSTAATSITIENGLGLAAEPGGTIFVTRHYYNGQSQVSDLLRISLVDGQYVTQVVYTITPANVVPYVVAASATRVYVTAFASSGELARIDDNDGTWTLSSAGMLATAVRGLARDSSGNFYTTAFNEQNIIRKVTFDSASQMVTADTVLAGAARDSDVFSWPIAVASPAPGTVTVGSSCHIKQVVGSTVESLTTGCVVPWSLAHNGPSMIFFTEGTSVRQMVKSGSTWGPPVTIASGLQGIAYGIAVASSTIIYVSDSFAHVIRKLTFNPTTSTWAMSTFAGREGDSGYVDAHGTSARLNVPQGLAVDVVGNLYVADSSNNRVRKITSAGDVTTFAGNGDYQTLHPLGLSFDSSGNLIVASYSTIRRITPAGVMTTLAGSTAIDGNHGTDSYAGFMKAQSVAVGPDGLIYVADQENHAVRIGRVALTDTPTIDSPTAVPGAVRQLGIASREGTETLWRVVRQPAGSNAALSSTTATDPTFTPDAIGLYEFELTSSNTTTSAIRTVSLDVTCSVSPATPVIVQTAGTNPSCSGDAVTLDAGAGYSSYLWSTAVGTRTITVTPNQTTSYSVTGFDASGCSSAPATFIVTIPASCSTVPTSVLATASSETSVDISWTAAIGAQQYQVARSENGSAFLFIASATSTAHTDNNVMPGKAYLYKVRTLNSGSDPGEFSPPDLATTVMFSDDPLITQTVIRFSHIDQLRRAVNAVRVLAGPGSFTFEDAILSSSVLIKAIHVEQLRSNLTEARTSLSLSLPMLSDAPTVGSVVRAIQVQELRDLAK